jgi:hypothetical protein
VTQFLNQQATQAQLRQLSFHARISETGTAESISTIKKPKHLHRNAQRSEAADSKSLALNLPNERLF